MVHSDEFSASEADIVVANILANILIDLAPHIRSLVKPGGHLVMSGILEAQSGAVMQAYAEQLDFQPAEIKEEWVLLHGRAH